MRNAVILTICIAALIVVGLLFFPETPETTTNSTKTEPPQETKVQLEGKRIECELKDYTDDGRIGVTTHYTFTETNSTGMNVFFKNISDITRPITLTDVFIEDRGGNVLALKKYEIIWRTSSQIPDEPSSLGPGEGVRVNYYFEKSEKLLNYFFFRNIYYDTYEYTVWKVKIVY